MDNKRIPGLCLECPFGEPVYLRIPAEDGAHDVLTVKAVEHDTKDRVVTLRLDAMFHKPRVVEMCDVDPLLKDLDESSSEPIEKFGFSHVDVFEGDDLTMKYHAASGPVVIRVGVLNTRFTRRSVRLRFAAPREVHINRDAVDKAKFRTPLPQRN